MSDITITVQLSNLQAEAFAHFCKKIEWQHFRNLATSSEQAYDMQAAKTEIFAQLISTGIFKPV